MSAQYIYVSNGNIYGSIVQSCSEHPGTIGLELHLRRPRCHNSEGVQPGTLPVHDGEQPGIQEEQRFASHHDIRNDSVGLAGLAKAAAAVIPLHVNIEVVVANKLGGADCAGDRLLSCAYHAREDINGAL